MDEMPDNLTGLEQRMYRSDAPSLQSHLLGASLMKSTVLILALSLASPVLAADVKPRVQPLRTVTVKLMPAGAVPAPWKISSLTERTCTVQTSDPKQVQAAFLACLTAKPEREGCRTLPINGKRQRVFVNPDGTWTAAGCDQSKVKGGRNVPAVTADPRGGAK